MNRFIVAVFLIAYVYSEACLRMILEYFPSNLKEQFP